jgi:serine/threonine-protein kinase
VAHHETGSAQYALASDGTLAYLTDAGEALRRRSVVWIDRDGVEETVNLPPGAYTHARVSPDGTRLALSALEQDRGDISVWDLRRETMLRLTTTISGRGPLWSPDGTRIAFTGWESPTATQHVYWQAADGSGTPEVLTTGSGEVLNAFSPDGRHLAFVTGSASQADIGLLTLGAERRQTILLGTPFREVAARISPDGRWIAYVSDESGRNEVYLRPFPGVGAAKQVVSTAGGEFPVWSRDGRELFYYVDPGTIVAVGVTPGVPLVLGKPNVVASGAARPPLGGAGYDISPDGKRLLVLRNVGSARSELRLILNWADALSASGADSRAPR